MAFWPLVIRPPVLLAPRERPADAPITGKKPARAACSEAVACRYCASAALMFWFEICTCAIRSSSAGSPNTRHQSARAVASCGSAVFQSPVQAGMASLASLNALGTGASGRW
ncbi:hypothetical protein D3C86_1671880 [compost metagenome]